MARKRAPKGSGTVRQRADGRWEARAPIGIDPGTGKQQYAHHYAKTETEAAKWLRKTTAAVDENTYQKPEKMTVGQWFDIWLQDYTGNIKERTRNLYTGHVIHRIKPAIGGLKLSALDAPTLQRFYNSLQSGEKPLAPKTIKNLHGIVHKALKQAVLVKYIRTNPADACMLPRVEKPSIEPLDSEDLSRFLDAIKGHPNERVFIADVFTGLRQGEILGLTWDCIDFDKGTINIYRQLQLIKGAYKFTSLKNDKTRRITPAQFVMDALREQRREQNAWRLKAGEAWQDEGFVFTNEIGEHLKRQTIYAQYKRIVASIGIPASRFHDMRHSYAVLSLQSGDDVKTVQQNMGHHTAAFTLDVYGHVSEEMKRESAARMDNAIKAIRTRKRAAETQK